MTKILILKKIVFLEVMTIKKYTEKIINKAKNKMGKPSVGYFKEISI